MEVVHRLPFLVIHEQAFGVGRLALLIVLVSLASLGLMILVGTHRRR